eukprot:1386584-Pyramimonas_sp.AAC.1
MQMKFSNGMGIRVLKGEEGGCHLRCWGCRWELSTLSGKRTSPEETASAFSPCQSCSTTTVRRCEPCLGGSKSFAQELLDSKADDA